MAHCAQARSKHETDAFIRYPRGFAELPVELLHAIVSHLRRPIIPWIWKDGYHDGSYLMPPEYRERRETLRALSQACRYLRSALLPLLWESLEACTVNPLGPRLDIGQELLGQLRLVSIGGQPYASYVLVVVVTITFEDAKASLGALAHAMTLMPSLHTIQINCECFEYERIGYSDFEDVFADHCYPSVRRAVLPVQAASILSCFPEVLAVHLNQNPIPYLVVNFVEALSQDCPKVEQFGWSEAAGHFPSIDAVIRSLPNIRILTLHGVPSRIEKLLELQCLERTSINFIRESYYGSQFLYSASERMVKATKTVFSGRPQPHWRLELVFSDGVIIDPFSPPNASSTSS